MIFWEHVRAIHHGSCTVHRRETIMTYTEDVTRHIDVVDVGNA